jgi:hypothetical protein
MSFKKRKNSKIYLENSTTTTTTKSYTQKDSNANKLPLIVNAAI